MTKLFLQEGQPSRAEKVVLGLHPEDVPGLQELPPGLPPPGQGTQESGEEESNRTEVLWLPVHLQHPQEDRQGECGEDEVR